MRSSRVVATVVVAVALSLVTACTSGGGDEGAEDESVFAGREMPEPAPKPEFTLTDTDGQSYDFVAETEGRITYLYFGYTYCPDVCPMHMAQLAAVLGAPGAPANTSVVFVTIDPERDSPEVLRDYLDKFDTDFVGLTGTPEELAAVQASLGLPLAVKEPNESDPENYTMGHAAQVIAFAPNGLNYTVYPSPTRQSVFAEDLTRLAALRTLDDVPGA